MVVLARECFKKNNNVSCKLNEPTGYALNIKKQWPSTYFNKEKYCLSGSCPDIVLTS